MGWLAVAVVITVKLVGKTVICIRFGQLIAKTFVKKRDEKSNA